MDGNTTSTEFDFNAIARHELGHAAGLNHVIDSQKIMHYSVSSGSKQNITSNSMYNPIITKITKDKSVSLAHLGVTSVDFSSCYKLSSGELAESPFTIFPNPASDKIFISSKQPIQAATVYNVLGKHVYLANEADGIGSTQLSLDVQNFAAGVYFISAATKKGSQSLRFIKE